MLSLPLVSKSEKSAIFSLITLGFSPSIPSYVLDKDIIEFLELAQKHRFLLIIQIKAACLSAVVTMESEFATINENIVV